jgi:hypothetical protein
MGVARLIDAEGRIREAAPAAPAARAA